MEQAGNGYGFFCHQQVTKRAHRASWEIYRGAIPDGKHVLHSCDNRLCVNPDHLSLGSHQENMADRNRKGRAKGPKGESAARSKLKTAQVLEMRRLHERNELTPKQIANRFDVDSGTVYRILKGSLWKHV